MKNCQICGAKNSDPNQKFCTKKCKQVKIDRNKPIYKAMLKRAEYFPCGNFGVSFDYQGNSV
jgi:hypothetical protein